MRVGWVGLGKLGLPCALVLDSAGHRVTGYDTDETRVRHILDGIRELPEEGLGSLLKNHDLALVRSILELVTESDIVFVAVQTPHAPEYGGETPAPPQRRDFDYTVLTQVVRDICRAALLAEHHITLAIVSTVLPGTCNNHIRPLLNEFTRLAYVPAFIAMGTTIADYTDPEFVLLGTADDQAAQDVTGVFSKVHGKPVVHTSVESAELAKVTYNTFISMKIAFANMVMEICHKTGADCDEVREVLAHANRRITSAAYLSGGMGDGGACHPRDLIAMSWLSQRLELSADLMHDLVRARESQSWWLAELAHGQSALRGLPVALLGKAYKAGSPLADGSPALLLRHQLGLLASSVQDIEIWDPHTSTYHGRPSWLEQRRVFVISARHPEFTEVKFTPGSVIIDPWGFMPECDGCTLIRVGRKS